MARLLVRLSLAGITPGPEVDIVGVARAESAKSAHSIALMAPDLPLSHSLAIAAGAAAPVVHITLVAGTKGTDSALSWKFWGKKVMRWLL